MKFLWLRALVLPAMIVFAGLAVWPFAGRFWALLLIAAGFTWILVRHIRNLQALNLWLRDPAGAQVPMGSGVWEDVFSALYRYVRTSQQYQHRLTGQLARFRSAGQAMPDGVIVLNGQNHIIWCNSSAERWFGLEARQDIGQHILNLVRNPEFAAYINGGRYDEPVILRVARGEELVLSLRVVPYGQDEKLLLSRDVTQAEKLETMRRDFVANVSHELKTPLTVVSGFLEAIADGMVTLDEPRGRQALSLMRSQTDRMLRLIEDLLMLSTLEASAAPSNESPIDVSHLLNNLQQEAQALSGARHTVLVRPGPAAILYGDEREITSAIGNLVSNAVRYTPAGGYISLVWDVKEGEGWVSVEDTGPGVEARHIPRLTERFYRIDTGRSRESGGTGLGLAIVKHVLTRHQGRLEIDSEVGRGSIFTAIFPARRVMLAKPVSAAGAVQ